MDEIQCIKRSKLELNLAQPAEEAADTDNTDKLAGSTNINPVADSDSELQLLKEENAYLKQQIVILQKMVDEHKNCTTQEGAGISGSNLWYSNNDRSFSFALLPDLALKKILKLIDCHQLLNCRLICSHWNLIIEDSAELIRSIRFPIWHVKPFLELPIVKKGKLRSILLRNTSPLEPEYKSQFIEAIERNSNIEDICFMFDIGSLPDQQRQPELLKLVLENCGNLRELSFMTNRDDSIDYQESLHFFRESTISQAQIRAANKIAHISVCVSEFQQSDANGLIELLMKLPKLKVIKLYGSRDFEQPYFTILRGVCRYLNQYGATSNLKELSVEIDEINAVDVDRIDEHELFLELITICAQYKVLLKELPLIYLNNFLEADGIGKLVSLSAKQWRPTVNGELDFNDSELKNVDLLPYLNFGNMDLYFQRDVLPYELSWIKEVNCFHSLDLHNELEPEGTKLGQPTINEFEATFTTGIPTLKKLEIHKDFFESIHVFRWSQYFPNLAKLGIHKWEITPDYLISELTCLESLVDLEFTKLPNLLDVAFTKGCVNKFAGGGGIESKSSLIPAIACFKSLKTLEIYKCQKLTEVCVGTGIANSKTLVSYKISQCWNTEEIVWEI